MQSEVQEIIPEVQQSISGVLREVVEELPEMESQAWDFESEEGLNEILENLKTTYWEEEIAHEPAPYVRQGDTWLRRVETPIEKMWGNPGETHRYHRDGPSNVQ